MENYPLLSNHCKLGITQIMRYITSFKEHKINHTCNKKNELLTTHQYKDQLSISIRWEILSGPFPIKVYPHINEVIRLHNLRFIKPIHYKINEFSKPTTKPSTEAILAFEQVSKTHTISRKRQLKKWYKDEFLLKRETTIKDKEFDKMILHIQNELDFKEFLKNRQLKNNN